MLQEQQQREREAENAALLNAVLVASPGGAKVLRDHIETHPNDQDNLRELVSFYQAKKDLKSLDTLTLWFIGQHPDERANWGSRPPWDNVWDPQGYEQGKKLWTEQLRKSWDGPYVYMNAAEYLSGNDNEQAEQILLEGQRRFPPTGRYSGLHWEVFLARHYAWALTGSVGQLPEGRMVVAGDGSGAQPAQSQYAQKVRSMLLASNDAELLDRVMEQLQGNPSNMAFAQSLNARALSIHPDDRQANMLRDGLQRYAVELRAQTDPGSLSDADRMVLLRSQLMPPAIVRADVKDTEAKARELLTLASHNTKDPNYGTATFLADMALGDAAFDRGDKSEAMRLFGAASEAPPTEYLQYNQIDMSLARKLVDAGERDAVAKFLDRCAKFNKGGMPLAEWAAQIRKGTNPPLGPEFDMFRKDMLRRKDMK
jgi:hypothetical protein